MEKTEKVLEKPEENFQVGISIDTLPSYTLKELAIFQIQDEHISKVQEILNQKIRIDKYQWKNQHQC